MYHGIIKALLLGSFSLSIAANEPSPNSHDRQKRKPPKEAFDACKGLSKGDKVTFTSARSGKAIEAVCRPTKDGEALVAKPLHHRPRPKGE